MRPKITTNRKRILATAVIVCSLGTFSAAHMLSLAHGGWSQLLKDARSQNSEQSTAQPEVERVVAEGRIATYPGQEITVSAESGGRVVRLLVQEKQEVHQGDLIAELDSAELLSAQAEAQAKFAELDSEVRLAELKLGQIGQLSPRAISTLEVSERHRDVETARARRDLASASLARIQSQLDKTRILAPIDGSVIARFTNAGQMVQSASAIVTIANLKQMRVEAEVNEFDGGKLRVGSSATITAEGYPGAWKGKVEEVPDVVISRQLRPQDPGRPSDTGVVLAKIRLLSPTPLKLGQRVEVSIDAGFEPATR